MIKHSTVIRAPHWFSGKQPRLSYIGGLHNIELPRVRQICLFQKKSGRSRNATKSQLGCIWMQFLQSSWNTSMMAISVSDICENTKVSHRNFSSAFYDLRSMNMFCNLHKNDCFQLAREMSLLGNYETASVYYQGVVQQVWSNSYEVSNFSQL